MDTLAFLRRVLPTTGTYCASVINGQNKLKSKFYSSLEDLSKYLINVSNAGDTAYFAVSTFEKMVDKDGALVFRRKAEAIVKCRLLALDIDVGKVKNSYLSAREALSDLMRVIQESSLPEPMIVSSGKGLHVYWVLKEELPYSAWKMLAEGLKATIQGYGLIIDPTVTADGARILRPIGTMHHAAGKPVKLLRDAEPVSFRDITPHLKAAKQAIPAAPAHVQKRVQSKLLDAIAVPTDLPPARADLIYDKCQAVRSLVDNAGGQSEPQWYMLVGLASITTEPEQAAIAWSEGHPDFNEGATLRKMQQWKDQVTGPPTCAKFNDSDSSLCHGCPHFGKITTPAQLGVARTAVAIDASAPEAEIAQQIPLPYGFKRTANGIFNTFDDVEEQVCDFDIYPVSYGYEGQVAAQVYRYRYKPRFGDWKPLVIKAYHLSEGAREFTQVMGDKCSYVPSQKQARTMSHFMRSYMEQLKKVKAQSDVDLAMGWKEEHSQFLFGDTLYANDGSTVTEEKMIVGAYSQANKQNPYSSSGSLASWVAATKTLEAADLPAHMFALGIGFSAPLYAFTGLKGITISLYGKTGAGKTLAQYWCQSIYGNPQHLHFSGKFTQNALFAKLGSTCHLPMTIDETTMMPDKDMGEFLYWVTQGRDKHRLNRTADERDSKEWATPVLCSTNRSMQSVIDSAGMHSEAQGARLLEVEVYPHKLFTKSSDGGRKFYEFLTENYGVAGPVYLAHLVGMGPAAIKKLIADRTKTFQQRYGIELRGEERYWEQALVLTDVGLEIADTLGLIKFDRKACIQWVIDAVTENRRTMLENSIDSFDILLQYFNEFAAEAVTVMNTVSTGLVTLDHQRIPRADIRIRYQLYRDNPQAMFTRGVAYIDRAHFKKWIMSQGGDWRQWTKVIAEEGADATPPSKKFVIGKDTPTKTGQIYVVGVALTHPRLEAILNDTEMKNLSLAVSNMKVVK